jgi:hypothetical protein
VGDLEELRIEGEAREAGRAEEPGRRGAGVGLRVDLVAAAAREDGAFELRSRRDAAVGALEEPASGFLIRGERVVEPPVKGPGLSITSSSGLPRSHARLSKSPNTWQLAQEESPWLDENLAS